MSLAPKMSLLIAGSRTFNDYELLEQKVDEFLDDVVMPIQIISGGATGADALAERYALNRNIPFVVYSAEWQIYGKRAGFRRNETMASACTHAIIFWDGKSRGAKNMISLLYVPTEIVRYNEDFLL